MLSKYNFYEYRPTKDTDLFLDTPGGDCIGYPYIVLTRVRGLAKISFVCRYKHPWLGQMTKVHKLYHKSAGRLLFTHRERGF